VGWFGAPCPAPDSPLPRGIFEEDPPSASVQVGPSYAEALVQALGFAGDPDVVVELLAVRKHAASVADHQRQHPELDGRQVQRHVPPADGPVDEIDLHVADAERHRSIGAARLGRSPDPQPRFGAAVWEIEGGEGQFRGAHGRITSNFVVSDTDELTDNHFGLIFVARAGATHASEARARAPRRPLGLRETWTEFRRSSGFMDLLAESALWTAPWTGFPPNQEPDCAEEFSLSATVWNDVAFYERRKQ